MSSLPLTRSEDATDGDPPLRDRPPSRQAAPVAAPPPNEATNGFSSGSCCTRLGDMDIGWDHRVLEPRSWTLAQSRWATRLLGGGPGVDQLIGARTDGVGPGPVLDLCSGVGYLGIDVARRTGRRVVQVDRNEAACAWARRNAEQAGVGELVEVRCAELWESLAPPEKFVLAMADPPYIPSDDVSRYPLDPPSTIDGGPDGLDVAREVLAVASRHLEDGGVLLLQVRGPVQAEEVALWLEEDPVGIDLGLVLARVRVQDPERAVALLRRKASTA